MAASLIGVIYDTATGAIRSVVVPDNDADLSKHVGPGQSLVSVSKAQFPLETLDDLSALVATVSGKIPPTPAHVVPTKITRADTKAAVAKMSAAEIKGLLASIDLDPVRADDGVVIRSVIAELQQAKPS
jgi:hypothetical protein